MIIICVKLPHKGLANKKNTLGNKPAYVVVFTLDFWQLITEKLPSFLSLLHVLIFKVDGRFKIYGYLIFESFFLLRRKRVPLSFISHVSQETPNEAKV